MKEFKEINQVKSYLKLPLTLLESQHQLNLACNEFKKVFIKEFPLFKLSRCINKTFGIKNV